MRKTILAFLLLISACQKPPQVSESIPISTATSLPQVEIAQPKATPVDTSASSRVASASDKNSDDFNLIHQFYGQPFEATAARLKAEIDQSGDRFSVENQDVKLYLETSDDSTITYIQTEFKGLGSCRFDKGVGMSKTLMEVAGLSSAKPIRSNAKSGYVAYMVEGIMVETSCPNEGDHYTLAAFRLR